MLTDALLPLFVTAADLTAGTWVTYTAPGVTRQFEVVSAPVGGEVVLRDRCDHLPHYRGEPMTYLLWMLGVEPTPTSHDDDPAVEGRLFLDRPGDLRWIDRRAQHPLAGIRAAGWGLRWTCRCGTEGWALEERVARLHHATHRAGFRWGSGHPPAGTGQVEQLALFADPADRSYEGTARSGVTIR